MKTNPAVAPARRAFRFAGRLYYEGLTALGVLALAGTLAVTAMVGDKELAVAIGVAGTFTGTLLITLCLPKVVGAIKAGELERNTTTQSYRKALEASETARNAAEERAVEAEREAARLEGMRINIDVVRPILNLGLVELETTITDFQHRAMDRGEPRSWWRNGRRQAYVGVIQVPIKAQLGVDLKSIRVRTTGDRLIVSGLAMTTLVDTGEGAKWLMDEVRTEYLRGTAVVKFKGDPHDPRAKSFSREHELQVRNRLRLGQDFQMFEAGLIRTAEQILRTILAPLGREIRFEKETSDGTPLLGFVAEHNRQITVQINAVREQQQIP